MHLGKMGADAVGWIGGRWNWGTPVGIGYANGALDEPHWHGLTIEVYLVAAGSAVAVIDNAEIPVEAGDVLVVEPHEVRTFISSSADYRSFVLHIGDDGTPDKVPVG